MGEAKHLRTGHGTAATRPRFPGPSAGPPRGAWVVPVPSLSSSVFPVSLPVSSAHPPSCDWLVGFLAPVVPPLPPVVSSSSVRSSSPPAVSSPVDQVFSEFGRAREGRGELGYNCVHMSGSTGWTFAHFVVEGGGGWWKVDPGGPRRILRSLRNIPEYLSAVSTFPFLSVVPSTS